MTLHLDDLPPEIRKRVAAADAVASKVAPATAQAMRRNAFAAIPLVCHTCGERFENPTEGRLTKHTNGHGHGVRYEAVLR